MTGHQNLKWTTPLTSSQISVVDCSGSGLFCSTLVITSATANETGLYRCFFKDLKVEDDKTSASVYVFVHDYKVPFVLSEKEYEVVFIREGQPVVIPCRGSVEDLNVTLHTFPPKEYNANGKDSVWEARTGFTIPSQLIRFAGVVFCQTKLANQTFKSPYYIVAVVGYKIHELMLTPAHVRLSVGERLVLSCTASTELNVGIDFNWTHSGQRLVKDFHKKANKVRLWNSLELSNTLTVDNVTVDHTGEYTCTASSGQMEKSASAFLKVYEKPFIELKDPRANLIELTVGDHTAEPLVPFKYEAYPEPSIQWYKDGLPIKVDYRVMPKNGSLVIHGVLEKDAGNYTVVLTNNLTNDKESHTFQLIVNVPPHIIEKEVAVDTDVYTYGSRATLRCTARGFPIPSHIQWEWMSREDCPQVNLDECTSWRHISNVVAVFLIQMTCHLMSLPLFMKKIVSSLKINKAEVHALYRCLAANKKGQDSRVIFFHVTRGLELTVSPSSEPIEEEPVVLRCKADRLIYRNLAWFRLSGAFDSESTTSVQPCRSLTLAQLPLSQAALSCLPGAKLSLELPLASASRHDEGMYVCQVENIKTREKICLLRSLTLRALEPARILNNMTDQKVNMSSTMVFRCDVTGTPHPSVVWTKNNHTVLEGSGEIILSERNQRLTIQRVKEEDSGLYTCTACNKRSCDSSQAFLTTEGAEEKTNVELIVPIGCVVIAMFFWLLIVFVIRGRKRPTGEDVKTGYLSMILDSEDMPVDEQCERLTYDATKWEFPQDRLKLGDPLGRGAFGQVVEAAAFGIEKNTTCTTVAVKMLKEGATSSEYRALMSELKILIHIGHHLNVVNLLGACTKPGGESSYIVKNGNLSSYLKSKRGEYSPFKVTLLMSPCMQHYDQTHTQEVCSKCCSVITESSDYDHLTMEDLISYSFQVSKGMEFLSSRKCIHRDLAARNILLSEHNVVKICDFGLARDVYKDPDYVRKGDARLPLKWMAPETIFDRVYTTQSDVWSFGVLLWEIFSLGASPYPGVCIDESFCRRLKEGTRMRAPDYATTEIYQTMLDCWLNCPTDRPTFSELVEHLGNLLQTSAQQVSVNQYHKRIDIVLIGRSQQSDRCSRPLSVKTFEDIPVENNNVMVIDELSPRPPWFFPSQLLRCKSKESVASEASNQTSGYQSGYHSDDTDTPIYANEDVIMKHRMLKNPPLPSKADKFNVDVRYSTPPV
uniref:receptor protein-tyrosine kinase n=1 Tax=Gadus morhua TaxID=8049 RepID=A0A8C5CUV5_GADMO